MLCSALIQPYFDYCCSSWYAGLSAKLKGRLDVLQRRMIRFILRMEPRDHVGQEHIQNLGWFSVPDRVRYFKLIHVFKVYNGTAPSYISDSFRYVSNVHGHITRQSHHNFHISKSDCIGQMSKSFLFTAMKEWNALPNSLKSDRKEASFKTSLRAHILNH